MVGVQITKGPQDWQIIQQEEGFGVFEAEGRFFPPEGASADKLRVYARLVREEDGRSLGFWQMAEQTGADGWKTALRAPAGGPYRLETCLAAEGEPALEWGTRGDMRLHLGVGDLYVIAGQSNSAGYGKDPVYDPPELGVHLYRNCGRWDLAAHPMNESTDTIHPVNQEGGNPGASPYLSFGKLLRRELGYPVGLLQTSLGGSPLCWWNPKEDGRLYRNMLEVVRSQGGKVKGVLWYQGCTDTTDQDSPTYLSRFREMVEGFRADMGAEVPFLTVQLSRLLGTWEYDNSRNWAAIREAQRRAALEIPGVSAVPALDGTMSDGIHISAAFCLVLGERLAMAALRNIYGKPGVPAAPELEKAFLADEKTAVFTFRNVQGRMFCYNCLPDITVWDEEGIVPAEGCELEGNTVRMLLSRPAKGRCKAGGGWEQDPKFPLPVDFNTHLPMLAFYEVPLEGSGEAPRG